MTERRILDTCIWLTPICSPIWLCVRSSTNRSSSTRRSRSVSSPMARRSASRTACDVAVHWVTRRWSARLVPAGVGASSDIAWYPAEQARASATSAGVTPRTSASSRSHGVRARVCRRSSSSATSLARSSWRRRGGRTAQPWSRNQRLTSPVTVGVANAANPGPAPGR